MQDAYTILRGASELKGDFNRYLLDLTFGASKLVGTASMQLVANFEWYITRFQERVGWEPLDNIMGDPTKCGALYCDVGVRNARVARRYMTTLAAVKPRLHVAKSDFGCR